ncbi:Zinc knuckle CX2CX4HX4C [Senna tora]|uniref:Zinc knuckle CX2CX4HX4C n=1 Tax=Senna tora TaxID=362788 RepID=A0A834W3G6_9FABA|nr:Zinc knuckle CX2CX4HX4C [Senna tora]
MCASVDFVVLVKIGEAVFERWSMEMQEDEVQLVWNQEEIRDVAEFTLIGKILTEKVLNKNVVVSMIRKGWNIHDGKWRIDRSFHEVNLAVNPIWIQIHGLPLEGLNRRNGVSIGMWITGSKGNKFWISFKYERLQNYCYGCGEERSVDQGDVIMEERKCYNDNSEDWKKAMRDGREVEVSKIMKNIKDVVDHGRSTGGLRGEGSGFDKGVEYVNEQGGGVNKGCSDIVLRKFDYYVEMPYEEDESGNEVEMQKAMEEEELARNLKDVVMKRKDEEGKYNAEIKRGKREVYVIEKEDFVEGKNDVVMGERRKGKKKMSKVVLESFQLFEVPISLGTWNGRKIDVEDFMFKAGVDNDDSAEGVGGCPLITTKRG